MEEHRHLPAAHIFSVLARPYKAIRANIRVDNHNHHDEGPIAPRVSPLLPGASLGTGQPWCDPSINDPIVHEQYGYSSGRDEDGVGAGMFTFVLCQVVVVYILYCIVLCQVEQLGASLVHVPCHHASSRSHDKMN